MARPGTPAKPTLARVNETSVTISWAAVSNTTRYHIQSQRDSTSNSWSNVVYTTSRTNTRSALLDNTRYRYRIAAVNSDGSSAYSIPSDWFYTRVLTPSPNLGPVIGGNFTTLSITTTVNTRYNYGLQIEIEGGSTYTFGNGETEQSPTVSVAAPTTEALRNGRVRARAFAGPASGGGGRTFSNWSSWSQNTILGSLWTQPRLTVNIRRANQNGTANPMGTYIYITASGTMDTISGNKMRLRAATKPYGATSYGAWTTNGTGLSNFTNRGFAVSGTFPISQSFEVVVELSDEYGATYAKKSISTADVAFSIGKNGVGVNRIFNHNNKNIALQVNGFIEQTIENFTVINGIVYQSTGRYDMTDVPVTTSTGGLFRSAAVNVPIGQTPPTGFGYVLEVGNNYLGVWGKQYGAQTTDTPRIVVFSMTSISGASLWVSWRLQAITSLEAGYPK